MVCSSGKFGFEKTILLGDHVDKIRKNSEKVSLKQAHADKIHEKR